MAKALVHSPPVLILDEPSAGVDIELREMLWDYIFELRSLGTTIILTTHYLEEAQKVCDNIGILNKGKIVESGKTAVLLGKIKKKVLGPDHIDLCSGYSNLGQIFYHRGDNLDDALECFGKVIKILKKVTGEKTLRVADTYELIGNIYKARSVEAFQAVIFDPSKKDHYKHLLDKSLEYTKKTLSIRTDILGPNDRKTKDAQEVLSWIIGLKEAPGTDW